MRFGISGMNSLEFGNLSAAFVGISEAQLLFLKRPDRLVAAFVNIFVMLAHLWIVYKK